MISKALVNRFLQPLYDQKIVAIKALVAYFLRALLPIFGLLFTKHLIVLLGDGDKGIFLQHFYYIVAAIMIYFVLRTAARERSWVHGYWAFKKAIRARYLPQVLHIDNNAYDKMGTGNLIHIIDSGSSKRAQNIGVCLRYTMEFSVSFAVTLYFISLLGWQYIALFIIILVIFVYVMMMVNKSMNEQRLQRIASEKEGTRRIVKMLMSKFDILQNNRTAYEVKAITDTNDVSIERNKKMSAPTEVFFLGPQISIYVCIIIAFYFG